VINRLYALSGNQRASPGVHQPGDEQVGDEQPDDFADLDTREQHLLAFGRRCEQIATPFEWKYTRADLDQLLNRVDQPTALG
jgi:hypothetical protein